MISPDVGKLTQVDFKVPWTMNEEIQTEERNFARFSMWYEAWMHMACPFYLLIANANCAVGFVCVGCMEMNRGRNADMTG